MRIFENHIIREKILKNLPNQDATNLMTALRPNNAWDDLFDCKKDSKRTLYCPICLLNTMIPSVQDGERTIGFRKPMNNIADPNVFPYALQHVSFHDEHEPDYIRQRSGFIFAESKNFLNYRDDFSVNPKSNPNDIFDYCSSFDFSHVQGFETEKLFFKHFEEVLDIKSNF